MSTVSNAVLKGSNCNAKEVIFDMSAMYTASQALMPEVRDEGYGQKIRDFLSKVISTLCLRESQLQVGFFWVFRAVFSGNRPHSLLNLAFLFFLLSDSFLYF